MTAPAGYKQLPSGFWVRDDGSGPYFVDVETGTATAAGSTSGQGGTVTNTLGSLTANDVILGNGGDDVKRVPGISSDGTSKLKLGVAGSSIGGVELRNGTSGSVTLQPVTGALGTVTLQAPAVDGTIATTQNIADAVTGLAWKAPCRVATTVAGTLASSFENGDTVDGVVLATNDRILIKNQAAGAENGLYTVNASGAPTRTTDADSGTEILNSSVLITAGTTNANRQYTCNTAGPITINVTALVFVQINASGGSVATDPIWQAEGDLVVGSGVATATRLPKGSALQALRRNAANNGFEYFSPAASGATDATAAAILALTTGDEGVIYHATSSSGVVVEDGYYIWNEFAGELQQLVAVTPAEAAAISDGYQGLLTWTAIQALTATEGMTASFAINGVIAYTRYDATAGKWKPLGGSQLIFRLNADAGQTSTSGAGTDILLAGCQASLPKNLLGWDGASLKWYMGFEKSGGTSESPNVRGRIGSAGTTADAQVLGNYALATTVVTDGLFGKIRRISATTVRILGAGGAGEEDRLKGTATNARAGAVTVHNLTTTDGFFSLSVVQTGSFVEYVGVNSMDLFWEG